MSLFGNIIDKIFHHGGAAKAAEPQPAQMAAAPTPAPAQPGQPAPQPATPAQPVDVEQILEGMASEKGGGGNWRTSIVDLLKLLDLDSSLASRKELADELDVHVAADGSAEENEALIKAVWAKLAANGGKVPAGLS